MGFDLEMENYLVHKGENGTATYFVGDNVICETNEKRYLGKIMSIGYYRKSKDSEAQQAIYLDTSKTKTSYSGEVIFVEDITYLYNDSAVYKEEAVHDLISIVAEKLDGMTEEEHKKVGKMLYRLL